MSGRTFRSAPVWPMHSVDDQAEPKPAPGQCLAQRSSEVRATLRDRLTAQAGPLLESGEQVQAVIWGQVIRPTSGVYASVRILTSSTSPYRVIVATDRRMLMCPGGRWTKTLRPEVLSELPREATLGPPRGLWHHTDALGERIYIQRSFFDEIAKADAAVADGAQ